VGAAPCPAPSRGTHRLLDAGDPRRPGEGRQRAGRYPFELYERGGLFRKKPVTGNWARDFTLSPGNHPVKVLVVRAGEEGHLTEVDAAVEAGALRTLAISLPVVGAPVVELR
jgi:hypothetical protein